MTDKKAMRVMLSKDAHVYALSSDFMHPLEGCWRWRLIGLEPNFAGTEFMAKVFCYPHGSNRPIKRVVSLKRIFKTFDEARYMAELATIAHADALRDMQEPIE